jgi:hypothetical protein
MNVFEVAIGKFVPSFGVLAIALVDSQMPFCALTEAMLPDELVLDVCRRPVLRPSAFSVDYNASLANEFFSVSQSDRVYFNRSSILQAFTSHWQNGAKAHKPNDNKNDRYSSSSHSRLGHDYSIEFDGCRDLKNREVPEYRLKFFSFPQCEHRSQRHVPPSDGTNGKSNLDEDRMELRQLLPMLA